MKLKISVLLLLVFVCSILPVLAQNTDTIEMVTYLDGLDREVNIPSEVTSVVTLAPSLTETLYFLDAESLIKAVDINSDYPESVSELDKVTSWDTGVNYEMLLSLDPDVVFASEMTSLDEISNMEDLGLMVYCVKNPADFSELFESILTIGVIIGREKEAVSLVENLEERLNAVEKAMDGCEDRVLVFYELDATDPTKPWTAGKGTFISDIIDLSCGVNLGDSLSGEWIQISLEALIRSDPAVILLGDAKYGNLPEAVAARTGWENIAAVKDGKLYEFDDNLVSRPGPRLVEGLEVIAHLLHPERFTEN
ncbi:MAG: ABC transporter substrate-binding protein [Anaerolineaceae bacterium]|nr:ABC transporter substrate-binding protein [Anaerolineaceae bacterium]